MWSAPSIGFWERLEFPDRNSQKIRSCKCGCCTMQIIGEAARSLSAEFRRLFPDPAWSKAIGLRNILVHHYFEIDEELIWQVVEEDLPPFRDAVMSALRQLEA